MRVCWRGTLPGGGPALPGASPVSATAAASAAALPEATTLASAAAMVAFAPHARPAGLARARPARAGHGEPGAVHPVTDPLIRVADAVPEEQQYGHEPGGDQRENERILH